MKIHEHQARNLLRDAGIPVPPGRVADSPEKAKEIAREIGGRVVVKAQVLVGGRGKAGGVKLADDPQQAADRAREILALTIKEIPVRKVLVSRAVEIRKEYYLGLVNDRTARKAVLIASAEGGVDIEELATRDPEKIRKLPIDPLDGIDDKALGEFLAGVFVDKVLVAQAEDIVRKLYSLFREKDCTLAEINPLAEDDRGQLIAADAKINFDDNALFRHPDVEAMRNSEEYSEDEIRAREANLSFVSLDGEIGCIVNGAGLAMATMDIIKLEGGEPANFLDVGGSSNPQKVLDALKIILNNRRLKAILINIFGGITRCDDIANGIVMARKQLDIPVPMVIRLIGTNEKEGREILEREGMIAAEKLTDAVRTVVEKARQWGKPA